MFFKLKKDKIKGILVTILLLIIGWFIISLVSIYNSKKKYFAILNYKSYTIGKYFERDTKARGATVARYRFEANSKKFTGNTTPASFNDSKPSVGNYYFVIYNFYNPEESIMFLNLEVPDSLEYLYAKNIKKLPNAKAQEKANKYILNRFNSTISKFFPPYYKEEEILKLINQ